jgi:predicted ester cyclase
MSELREIVDRHYKGLEDKDIDASASVLADDVLSVMPGAPPMHGIQSFTEYGRAFFDAFPDARMRIKDVYEAGDTIIVEGSFVGTHTAALVGPNGAIPATGKSIDLPFADIFRVRGGKVYYHAVYFDQMTMMTQFGLMPEPAQAGA